MNLPFFTVADNLISRYIDAYPKFFEWTNITFAELVSKLPNYGFTYISQLAEFLNAVFGTDIEIPYFDIKVFMLYIFDFISTEIFGNQTTFSDMTVFGFILGYGATVVATFSIARWFVKLFD